MVAAGVYLAGRFYPMFVPEVLLVIAYVGCITLFVGATIAVVAATRLVGRSVQWVEDRVENLLDGGKHAAE